MKQALDFLLGQHRRNTSLRHRAANIVQPRQLYYQHFLVEKQQGTQGLPVCGGRHLALVRQHGQKSFYLGLAQATRVTQAMKLDEPAHPVEVGLLCAQAVVQIADALTHLVQQTRRLQGRTGRYIAGFVDQRDTVHMNSIYVKPNKIKAPKTVAQKIARPVPMLFRTFAGFRGLLCVWD